MVEEKALFRVLVLFGGVLGGGRAHQEFFLETVAATEFSGGRIDGGCGDPREGFFKLKGFSLAEYALPQRAEVMFPLASISAEITFFMKTSAME